MPKYRTGKGGELRGVRRRFSCSPPLRCGRETCAFLYSPYVDLSACNGSDLHEEADCWSRANDWECTERPSVLGSIKPVKCDALSTGRSSEESFLFSQMRWASFVDGTLSACPYLLPQPWLWSSWKRRSIGIGWPWIGQWTLRSQRRIRILWCLRWVALSIQYSNTPFTMDILPVYDSSDISIPMSQSTSFLKCFHVL